MAWLKIYQSIRQHRKILDITDTLEIAPAHAMGLVISFWLWALDNAPDGDISNISTRNIARAAQWEGDADKFVQAFISAGFLNKDEGSDSLIIHNWEEYVGTLLQQREADRSRAKKNREKTKNELQNVCESFANASRTIRSKDKTRLDKTRVDKEIQLSTPPEYEAEPAPSEKADPTPYTKIMQLYNDTCVSFPKIQKIDGARRKAVAARYKSYPDIDTFETLFRKTEASGFMKGENERNWCADFDWIIKATNMCKVLEGKYDNKGGLDNGAKKNGSRYELTGFTSAE